jgi:DNA-binding protein HU-beta
LNQQELATQIVARARQAGYEIPVEVVTRGLLPAFEGATAAEIKRGGKVTLQGFGTFERRERKARVARNPRSGEAIKVKATKIPAFKVSAPLKIYVAGGKSTSTRAPAWMGMTATPRGRAAATSATRATSSSGRGTSATRTRTSSSKSGSGRGPGPVKRSARAASSTPSSSSRSSRSSGSRQSRRS